MKQLMSYREYRLFLILETSLYLGFLSLDIAGFSFASSILKYCSILGLLSFLFYEYRKERGSKWILLAFTGSATADIFLLFTDRYLEGILCFLFVQCVLFLYLQNSVTLSNKRRIAYRIAAVTVLCIVLCLLKFPIDAVSVGAVCYIVLFAGNVLDAFAGWCKAKETKSFLLFLGLLLFFICDIHVGLYNLSSFILIQGKLFMVIERWAGFAMWLFYLPGQFLIGSSSIIPDL